MSATRWARVGGSTREVDGGKLFVSVTREELLEELGIASVGRVFEDGFAHVLRELPDRSNAVLSSSAGLLFLIAQYYDGHRN